MNDWMDMGWLDFVFRHQDASESSPQVLALLKDAWLHGARTAARECSAAFPDADGPCAECLAAGAVLTCIFDHESSADASVKP
jgi:hypothetical protein